MKDYSSEQYIQQAIRWLILLSVAGIGCQGGEIEGPEHHFPAHKPEDFPAAVARMQELHQEILAGPLVVREVHVTHDHHHHHDHDHSDDDDHSHEITHVHLDALQEMNDLVRWLPELAADSDLAEAPWNELDSVVRDLEVILAEALGREGESRRKTYLSHEEKINQCILQIIEIERQFPQRGEETSSHTKNRITNTAETQGAN